MRTGTVDILFANESELHSLYQTSDFDTAAAALRQEAQLAVVTRGHQRFFRLLEMGGNSQGVSVMSPGPSTQIREPWRASDRGYLAGVGRDLGKVR